MWARAAAESVTTERERKWVATGTAIVLYGLQPREEMDVHAQRRGARCRARASDTSHDHVCPLLTGAACMGALVQNKNVSENVAVIKEECKHREL